MTAAGRRIPEGARLVHIGPHKTGSTAIQVALNAARDRLAEHGVAYVTTGGYRARKAGWALGVRGRPSGTGKPPLRHWRRFVEAVQSADAPRVCVSNEDFGRATPAQVARLVEDLGGDRVQVLSVVRRLDRYLPSQWQERVKAGEERTYDAWLRVVLDTENPEPNWDRRNVWYSHDVRALVERWVKVVGPERFTVVVSDEADHSVLPGTFESMLGLPELGGDRADPQRQSAAGGAWVRASPAASPAHGRRAPGHARAADAPRAQVAPAPGLGSRSPPRPQRRAGP
jgi:hypothetical protein